MFRFVLLRPDGEPNDPVVLVTPTRRFAVDEVFTVGGEQRRVVAIPDEVSTELVAQGFGGVLVVEPVGRLEQPSTPAGSTGSQPTAA